MDILFSLRRHGSGLPSSQHRHLPATGARVGVGVEVGVDVGDGEGVFVGIGVGDIVLVASRGKDCVPAGVAEGSISGAGDKPGMRLHPEASHNNRMAIILFFILPSEQYLPLMAP